MFTNKIINIIMSENARAKVEEVKTKRPCRWPTSTRAKPCTATSPPGDRGRGRRIFTRWSRPKFIYGKLQKLFVLDKIEDIMDGYRIGRQVN